MHKKRCLDEGPGEGVICLLAGTGLHYAWGLGP